MAQSGASSDAFNDSLDFVKKLWGQMGVPGMSASAASAPGMSIPGIPAMALPSMSLEDLDKRIQELKTVETWLNVNMTMLRNTIQALEVQRATIATLHSLSSTMAKTMQGMNSPEAYNPFASKAEAAPEPRDQEEIEEQEASPLIAQSASWWQGVQDQFKLALGTALEKSAANYEMGTTVADNFMKTEPVKKPASRSKKPVRASAKPPTKAKTVSKTKAPTRARKTT